MGRANSLNLVRLFLASSVIFWHAWPTSSNGSQPGWLVPLGELAVPGFFCLSGFLIARSRMRLSFVRFMWHRSLRILPGVWVALAITALVAAPLSTLAGGSWDPALAAQYALDNAKLRSFVWGIPGTIDDLPWNGSLWSLSYEYLAYVAAGVLLTLRPARRHAGVVVPVVLALTVAAGFWATGPGAVSTSLILTSISLGTYFLAGMVLYFWADRVPIDARLAVAALVMVGACWHFDLMDRFGGLPLAYVLLWLGAAIPARWAQRNDISYGVYVYAWPVQVLTWWLVPGLPVPAYIAIAFLVVVPLAWASWLLVERPAMQLRNLGRHHSAAAAPATAGTTRDLDRVPDGRSRDRG